MLREYQQRAIDQLYAWFASNDHGHPCLVLPTGAGKSHIVAALCKDAIQNWPETRVLMLTHVKELIQQNAEKMRQHWPNAPMGIYSAGLRQRTLGEPITFAGIQSVRSKASQIGHVDLVVVDECHLINHSAEGGYRQLIDALTEINPRLRVIGLTATPYRLGHGLIIEGDAIFDALIEPVSIAELVEQGYLSPLRSKLTEQRLEVDGVKKRGGEYIESQLQAAVNVTDLNESVVREVIKLAGERKAWLFFCAGVDHAEAICGLLNDGGIPSACVTGATPAKERARILDDYKAGKLRALTNANVLTTGFDYPDIDLIAMLRPTLSPGLYVQMAGRGLRIKSHADHCLVLDFAGNVERHGPITAVEPPTKKKGEGLPPTKACPECSEIVSANATTCPSCGHVFPPQEKEVSYKLTDEDIMGMEAMTMEVSGWQWRKHTSRTSGKEMLAVTYYPEDLAAQTVTEYFPLTHGGYAQEKASRQIMQIAYEANAQMPPYQAPLDLASLAVSLQDGNPPTEIDYRRDGKFYRVIARRFARAADVAGRQDPDQDAARGR